MPAVRLTPHRLNLAPALGLRAGTGVIFIVRRTEVRRTKGFSMTAETASTEQQTAPPQPLRSQHTTNFPALLAELGVSLLVTTYQAGKLVLLRADGDRV